ncbi:hypothetical protein J0K78_07160 [Halobacillus sp. GSS1]|uniref:hypothetical protein n=1 Tax=Halobacillus sp. GSS1 TaxID=2815919 RepID=UPI001A8E31B2|nr:hypothetical protein [Halobacillus sp. GSS1]MBN9654037.1 hypothetical protein [Halobacillus sp. GSS1]
MKKKWLRLSPIFVIPCLLVIHSYLSLGGYAVPFGIALVEGETAVEKYNWSGHIVQKVSTPKLTSGEKVQIYLMDSHFKQTFASLIMLILVAVYAILLEWLSRVWKVSLEGVMKTPKKWKPVMIGVVLSFYVFAAFHVGAQYVELVQESETLLHKFVP